MGIFKISGNLIETDCHAYIEKEKDQKDRVQKDNCNSAAGQKKKKELDFLRTGRGRSGVAGTGTPYEPGIAVKAGVKTWWGVRKANWISPVTAKQAKATSLKRTVKNRS